MDRRTLIAAGTVALTGGLPHPAAASSEASAAPASLSIAGLGLPVIDGGRLRNYVFVALRLELGAGKTMEQIKPKEAFFRDALVRAAHRTPFTVPGDWTRLDERALSAALVSASAAISGAWLHPACGNRQPNPASSDRDATSALSGLATPVAPIPNA